MSTASWRAVRMRILDARFRSSAGCCSPAKTATRGCTSGWNPSAHVLDGISIFTLAGIDFYLINVPQNQAVF